MEQTKSSNLISVIIRSHDPNKEWILRHALQSVAAQTYQHLEVVLVLQNYSEEQVASLEETLRGILSPRKISFQCELIRNIAAQDLRAHALNRGLTLSKGARIAFLDYDDVFYPDALERLSNAMDRSGAGCVVGATDFAFVEIDFKLQKIKTLRKERFFRDAPSVRRLRHNSFIPIHSFLVDKSKSARLSFPEDMCLFEDYAYLLELSACTDFDFSLFHEKALCEYRVERHGGASIPTLAEKNPDLYLSQKRKIWNLRKRLGFLGIGYFTVHPFYFPWKTKLSRFFNKT